MKRLFALATLALLALVPSAFAQDTIDTVAVAVAADDTSPAFVLVYVGTEVSGKAEVAAAAINLIDGAAGAEAADTSIECPLSGAYGGIVDITNAACDTVGELADVINGTSGSQWRMFPVTALRTDYIYNTNKKVLTAASASANKPNGVTVYWDTNVAFHHDVLFAFSKSLTDWFDANNNLRPNPYKGAQYRIVSFDGVSTYGSGSSGFELYTVAVVGNPNTNKYTETATKVYAPAGGATTVWANKLPGNGTGFTAPKGQAIVLKLVNSAAQASAQVLAFGEALER